MLNGDSQEWPGNMMMMALTECVFAQAARQTSQNMAPGNLVNIPGLSLGIAMVVVHQSNQPTQPRYRKSNEEKSTRLTTERNKLD